MKKYLCVILIFFTLNVKGQTSVYHPFPDSAAVWNIHFLAYCFFNGDGNDYYSITFSGDTIVNSQTYHKLSTPFIQSFSTGICGSGIAGYRGAIRQDITNKKVFYLPPADSTEELLYDFNMQVGDTVKGYIETYAIDTVESIDSVLVGSSYRKRWTINSCYNIQLIEGIGSTYGLIRFSPGCATDGPAISVICFRQNGQSLYPATSINCELITSDNFVERSLNKINIFPNPSNGSFTIDLDKADVNEIKVYNLLGSLIFCKQVNKQTKFDIDNLQHGIYILSIIGSDNKTTNRVIICNP